jgi:phosphodiesterase/alkaline phosphatase D-like protein
MPAPIVIVVGHCTDTAARVFCCARKTHTAARIAWSAAGQIGTQDLELTAASPYNIGVFDLRGLPASARVTYAIDAAAGEASLASPASMLAPQADTRTFRLLPTSRPLRLGLVSCNGGFQVADVRRRHLMWRKLRAEIEKGNIDVLIHGGDQIYADAIWMKHDASHASRGLTPDATARVAAVTEEYRRWYVERAWDAPDIAAVLAAVPNLMMWDDHDIYDGYGSNDDDDEPPQQAFLKAAAQAFSEFQTSHGPGALGPRGESFLTGFIHGDVGVLLLDTRFNRRWKSGIVLGAAQLQSVEEWLDAHAARLRHLFVVSSIPIVHAKVTAALKLIELLPGNQGLEDDLREAWTASRNRAECQSLCKRLFGTLAKNRGLQITILSGDVHVGALAEVESLLAAHQQAGVRRMFQVTSSGVGHPPVGGIAMWAVRKLLTSAWVELGCADFRGRLLTLNGVEDQIIEARNFAVIRLEGDDGAWHSQGNVYVDFHAETPDGLDTRVLPQTLNG